MRALRLAIVFPLVLNWQEIAARSQAVTNVQATLTSAEQVRRLTPEQAALGYPVRIRGVVTMDAPAPDFFV